MADPEEVAALRRVMRLRLGLWELGDVAEAAQLCVTELVSNVIKHVGCGTPTTLVVSMNGPRLRIEVHDPDVRALPTLVQAEADSESGRGMALVDIAAVRWGVELRVDRKVTWCELATAPASASPVGHSPRSSRVQELLELYEADRSLRHAAGGRSDRLASARVDEAAVDLVVDLLHWLHAHGRDADDLLDRAQIHFEAEAGLSAGATAGGISRW